jgi:ketosteroid isomerase-like protein
MSESAIHATMRALALKLVNAAATNNLDDLKDVFDPKAVIWHSTDDLTITIADNQPIAAVFFAKVPHPHYEDIRITPFDSGYVQQHQWVGETIDGKSFRVSACAIMQVRDGKIVRIDEYFDSAPFIRLGLDTWLPKDRSPG